MSTKLSLIISFLLIAIAAIAGIVLYTQLPDPMPSHWNAAGEVDGYMSKFWGVFLLPLITIGITLLLSTVPFIDPLKANIEKFRPMYNIFIVAFVVYMLYVYTLTMGAALGWNFNMSVMLLPAVGLLFIGIGYMMRGVKRNFFIGIRTPWTLSNDYVWDETHRVGSWAFMAGGVLTIISAFLGENGFVLMMIGLAIAGLTPVVYSYIVFAKLQK